MLKVTQHSSLIYIFTCVPVFFAKQKETLVFNLFLCMQPAQYIKNVGFCPFTLTTYQKL